MRSIGHGGEPVTWWEFCERMTGLDVRKGVVVLGTDGEYHYADALPKGVEPSVPRFTPPTRPEGT